MKPNERTNCSSIQQTPKYRHPRPHTHTHTKVNLVNSKNCGQKKMEEVSKNFDSDPHLARANSPKYSVIANISGCHPKVNFGTLARKSNTGRDLVPLLLSTLNTNWLLLLSTHRTVLPTRGVDPLSPHPRHLSTASSDIPQHPSRQMRVRISLSVNFHTKYGPDCYLSHNSELINLRHYKTLAPDN